MNLIGWVRNFFRPGVDEIHLTTESLALTSGIYYKTLATEASIALIAKTLSRAEFKTFEDEKETRKKNYYLLNVEANQNQSAPAFWKDVITALLKTGEALIIMQGHQFYLATSFERVKNAFEPNQYKNIEIGGHKIKETKNETDVIYLRNDNEKMRSAVNGLSDEFSSLVASSIKGYNASKARKGTVDVPTSYAATIPEQEKIQDHFKSLFKDFMDSTKDSVLPQTNGLKYTEVDEAKGSKSNDSGRETKNFVNDIFDFVAISFGIPPSLLKGDTVDTADAFNNFITFCINPLAELIEDEINRKFYGKKAYLEFTYTKIDTTTLKATDIKELASAVDLLTRTGSTTIDENMKILGKEPVGGEVGAMRFVTKNMEYIDYVLEQGTTGSVNSNQPLEGGEND